MRAVEQYELYVAALLENGTVEKAAKVVGTTRQTFYNVMAEPEFKELYKNARIRILEEACTNMLSKVNKCVDTISAIAEDETATKQIRLNACDMLLRNFYRMSEQENLLIELNKLKGEMDKMRTGIDKKISAYLRLAELCGINEDDNRKEYMRKAKELMEEKENNESEDKQ